MDILGTTLSSSASTAASVVFWSGAGISHDEPTSGPLGAELIVTALERFFLPSTYAELQGMYRELGVPNADTRPRLETVLASVRDTYGAQGLADALRQFAVSIPNSHHRWFRRHIEAGGAHITANFDTCIERAGSELLVSDRLVHFHGTLGVDTDSALNLGATLPMIENGLAAATVNRLDTIIGKKDARALVFVGYSGSDFADATPYLLSRTELLRDMTIIWLDHEARTDIHFLPAYAALEEPAQQKYDLLAQLTAASVPVIVAKGSLAALRTQLSHALKLPDVADGSFEYLKPEQDLPEVTPTDDQRWATTLHLFASMGLRRRVMEMCEMLQPASPQQWDRLADARWGAGLYRASLEATRCSIVDESPSEQARLLERECANDWIRGRLLRAERRLWREMPKWGPPDYPGGPESAAKLYETYARTTEHMGRLPFIRRLVRRQRVAQVQSLLHDARVEIAGREGIALRARFTNVESAVRGEADESIDRHVYNFSQSEALHAWMNYRQGELRARVEHGLEPPPNAAEYKALLRHQEIIGATGDVARVYLVPGAARWFRPSDAWAAMKVVDYTFAYRMTLFAGFLLPWLRLRASRRQLEPKTHSPLRIR